MTPPDGTTGATPDSRGAGVPQPEICWRCRDAPDRLREVDHPDSAIDRSVRVCAMGCWLPESVTYCCHNCGEDVPPERVRLVRAPTRADLVPECLRCNRAVVTGD